MLRALQRTVPPLATTHARAAASVRHFTRSNYDSSSAPQENTSASERPKQTPPLGKLHELNRLIQRTTVNLHFPETRTTPFYGTKPHHPPERDNAALEGFLSHLQSERLRTLEECRRLRPSDCADLPNESKSFWPVLDRQLAQINVEIERVERELESNDGLGDRYDVSLHEVPNAVGIGEHRRPYAYLATLNAQRDELLGLNSSQEEES